MRGLPGDVSNRQAINDSRKLLIVFTSSLRNGPRIQRVRALKRVLAQRWEVEEARFEPPRGLFFSGEAQVRGLPPAPRRAWSQWCRAAARFTLSSVLIDRYELRSWQWFRRPEDGVGAALLVGAPYSPLFAAAQKLAEAGIRYVVDVGDPLTLTAPSPHARAVRGLARLRAGRSEADLWRNSSGAIVTSESVASVLRTRFPSLPVLLRPNGFDPTERPDLDGRRERGDGTLRLVHFGTLYDPRIDPSPVLDRLAASGRWNRVELRQFGPVWGKPPTTPDVTIFDEVPWSQAAEVSRDCDAAVVVGNKSGLGPMSKVFTYHTLPLPRIALVADPSADETAAYVSGRSGWLVVGLDDPDPAMRVAAHVDKRWTADALAPPVGDSWSSVAEEVASFLEQVFAWGPSEADCVALASNSLEE